VRIAAAVAAVSLAVGLPVLIVLLGVVGERWRDLIGALIVVFVTVPLVRWFTGAARPRSGGDATPDGDEPGAPPPPD
jgi:hypothetical protein